MASDYFARYVLIGYYAENQEAGTNEERAEFRDDLFARYDHHIVEAAAEADLELSDESRSIIAMLATMASGAAPKTRARKAVKAYVEYRGL